MTGAKKSQGGGFMGLYFTTLSAFALLTAGQFLSVACDKLPEQQQARNLGRLGLSSNRAIQKMAKVKPEVSDVYALMLDSAAGAEFGEIDSLVNEIYDRDLSLNDRAEITYATLKTALKLRPLKSSDLARYNTDLRNLRQCAFRSELV